MTNQTPSSGGVLFGDGPVFHIGFRFEGMWPTKAERPKTALTYNKFRYLNWPLNQPGSWQTASILWPSGAMTNAA